VKGTKEFKKNELDAPEGNFSLNFDTNFAVTPPDVGVSAINRFDNKRAMQLLVCDVSPSLTSTRPAATTQRMAVTATADV